MPADRILTSFMRGLGATARGQVPVIFLVGGVMANEYVGGVCFHVRAGIPPVGPRLGATSVAHAERETIWVSHSLPLRGRRARPGDNDKQCFVAGVPEAHFHFLG